MDDCERPAKSRGLCHTHYMREWRGKNRERAREIGRASAHRRKAADPTIGRAAGLAYYHRNRDGARDARLRKRYGISLEDYRRVELEQDGKCAVCRRPPNGHGALHVDHDHDSGHVRGLLCFSCNYAIGAFKDSPTMLQRAIDYLAGTPVEA